MTEGVKMKKLILVICFLCGCSGRTPSELKARDHRIAECKEACAPREFDTFNIFGECLCKDNKK